MMGYNYGYVMGDRSPGTGNIWLDDVECSGLETDIADCTSNSWGDHNCSHGEDVSVQCVTIPPTGENVNVSTGKVVCMIHQQHL